MCNQFVTKPDVQRRLLCFGLRTFVINVEVLMGREARAHGQRFTMRACFPLLFSFESCEFIFKTEKEKKIERKKDGIFRHPLYKKKSSACTRQTNECALICKKPEVILAAREVGVK